MIVINYVYILDSMSKLPKFKFHLAGKLVPALVVVIVLMAFALGAMWGKLQGASGPAPAAGTTTQTTQAAPAAPVQPKVALADIKSLFNGNYIQFGDANRKLLFVEVADPSCPYCHVAGGLNPQLNAQVGSQFKLVSDGGSYIAPVVEMHKLVDAGKASFVWIYSPGHGNGEMGTKALYCAADLGKFWEVHDKLMTSAGYDLLNTKVLNDKTKSGEIASFLAGAVDTAKLKSCLDSGKYDQRLSSDQAQAAKLGVNGTPGFFINETNFAGAYSWKDMQPVADAALK